MRTKTDNLQYLILTAALLFAIATPRSLILSIESPLEIILFAFTLFTTFMVYKRGIIWVFMFFLIIAIYYNPVFLIYHDIKYTPILDSAISLSFFVIALFWEKILLIHKS